MDRQTDRIRFQCAFSVGNPPYRACGLTFDRFDEWVDHIGWHLRNVTRPLRVMRRAVRANGMAAFAADREAAG